jgi:hypothetical protein
MTKPAPKPQKRAKKPPKSTISQRPPTPRKTDAHENDTPASLISARQNLQLKLYATLANVLGHAERAAKRGHPALLRLIARSLPKQTAADTTEEDDDDPIQIIYDIGQPEPTTREGFLEKAERTKGLPIHDTWLQEADRHKPASEGGGLTEQALAEDAQRAQERAERDAAIEARRQHNETTKHRGHEIPAGKDTGDQNMFQVGQPGSLDQQGAKPPLSRKFRLKRH